MTREQKAEDAALPMPQSLGPEEVKVLEEGRQESTSLVKIEVPMVHVAVRHAFEQLRDDIIRINEDPSYVTLLMAVNTRTAKAELIPIPTIDNMTRIKDNLDQFPEAVQNAIKKNIPEADMKASTEIWEYLGKIKEVVDKNEKAIQEKPMREELGGAKNHDARNHA